MTKYANRIQNIAHAYSNYSNIMYTGISTCTLLYQVTISYHDIAI